MDMKAANARKQRVLEERAELLARALRESEDSGDRIEVALCTVGSEVFALPLEHLREIVPLPALTPVPSCPDWVLGITHVRGNLMSVLHLGRFCGTKGESDPQQIAVVEGASGPIGLSVDAVTSCRHIKLSELTSADERVGRRVALGVTRDLSVVLDIPALLNLPELVIE